MKRYESVEEMIVDSDMDPKFKVDMVKRLNNPFRKLRVWWVVEWHRFKTNNHTTWDGFKLWAKSFTNQPEGIPNDPD